MTNKSNMKVRDLLAASGDAEIEIVHGELYIYEPTESQIEYKFNIGDRVTFKGGEETYTITDRFVAGKDCPTYELDDCENVEEDKIELYVPQDITERIKKFEDACEVLGERNRLVQDYQELDAVDLDSPDIVAYLKLRIITCALNEGWEPTFGEDEERWHIIYDAEDDSYDFGCSLKWETAPNKLVFKSERLAEYAAEQFRDIYVDFCGCKKGGEV